VMEPDVRRMLKHELRTPVNHMIGYVELLLEEATDDGLDDIAVEASQIHADSKAIAAEVERYFASWTGDSIDDACLDLKAQIGPLVDRVIEQAQSSIRSSSGTWAAEFRHISVAANKLSSMISRSRPLDEVTGGVAQFVFAGMPTLG
jgi:signal transduction histidine kinase